jgi:hypothetical protein
MLAMPQEEDTNLLIFLQAQKNGRSIKYTI